MNCCYEITWIENSPRRRSTRPIDCPVISAIMYGRLINLATRVSPLQKKHLEIVLNMPFASRKLCVELAQMAEVPRLFL